MTNKILRRAYVLVGFLTIPFLSQACGTKGEDDSLDSSQASEQQEFVDATVQIDEGSFALAGFSLAGTATFTAAIEGCVSGWSKTDISSDGTIQVPNGDTGCVFKLTQFVIGSESYTSSLANISNDTWKTPGSTTITGTASSKISFQIVSTLESTITGAQTIQIKYQGFEQAQSSSVSIAVDAGISVEGSDPINLEFASTNPVAVSINSEDGAGEYALTLTCDTAIDGENKCDGVDLDLLKVKLIHDDTESGTLDLDTCLAKANDGSSVADTASYAINNIDNGGVTLSPIVPVNSQNERLTPLYGTTDGKVHNKTILVLASGEEGTQSCKYYNIEVQRP